MNKNDEKQILDLLYGVAGKPKMASLKSIAEKRTFLTKYLANNIDFMDLSQEIDVESEEVQALISENFLFVSEEIKCFEDEGFTPWLDEARSGIEWKFYDRYEKYLLYTKNWDWKTVSLIKNSTDIILDHMANPNSDLYFKKRGLVIGDIQSGKTANYTALINKAIDAGYKIIVVLAGLTRDLRNQTQRRIDLEALGFETKSNQKGKSIGVGNINPLNIEGLTYADEEKDYGDFKKYFNSHTLDKNSMTPLVAIVKKNKSVLDNLAKFLKSSQEYCYTDGKLNAPVLIIDDEVDQASVDTNDADELEKASAINKGIRTILECLNRYAYVGYTATPFANVFIDPDKENDLYPRDFILCLDSSDKYCGIKEYFGVDIRDESDDTVYYENDLFRNVDDFDTLFAGQKMDARLTSIELPKSMKDAIRSFIIASSIKKQRGIIGHNSMLIHVARFKNPATTLKPLVVEYLNKLYKKLKYEYDEEVEVYREFWESEFMETSMNRFGDSYCDDWNSIKKYLLDTISASSTGVKVVNGDLNDQVDYSSSKEGEHIVIGGDKLSRGLTLDGLVISYYYRKSKMYDSLLQMGRWFGYRNGWIDVCRVYTTVKILNDFIYSGRALERFRQDINDMYAQKKNPREVGQKIMYSPNLIPTSRSKMKHATKAKISFSEEVQQIISFSKKHVSHNFELTKQFIESLGEGEVRSKHKVVFKNISVDTVLGYLEKYKDADEYKGQISIVNWIKYIKNVNKLGELKTWTIVLNSLKEEEETRKVEISKYTIYKARRTLREEGNVDTMNTFLIKTNIDPTDFREIFDPLSEKYKTITHYDKKIKHDEFTSETGLMSIYIEDLCEKVYAGHKANSKGIKKATYKQGAIIPSAINVAAPAIWFPQTKNIDKSAVLFYVNDDYKKQMDETNYDVGDDLDD